MTEAFDNLVEQNSHPNETSRTMALLQASRIGGLLVSAVSAYVAHKTGNDPTVGEVVPVVYAFTGGMMTAALSHREITTTKRKQEHKRQLIDSWETTRIDDVDVARKYAYARQRIELEPGTVIARNANRREMSDREHAIALANIDARINAAEEQVTFNLKFAEECSARPIAE